MGNLDQLVAVTEERPLFFHVPIWHSSEIGSWDPDEQPMRFASGIGHSILELARRLDVAGCSVALGSVVPRTGKSCINVVFSKALRSPDVVRLIASQTPALQILSDDASFRRRSLPWAWRVVPHPDAAVRERDLYVPLLPQRGLTQRRRTRGAKLQRIAYVGLAENTPEWLASERLAGELDRRGISLEVRTRSSPGGWTDFRELDAVLSVRGGVGEELRHVKPPTKVINGLAAGCLVFAEDEPATLALAAEHPAAVRLLRMRDPDGLVEAIDDVLLHPDRREAAFLEANATRDRYGTRSATDRWVAALAGVLRAESRPDDASRLSRLVDVPWVPLIRYDLRAAGRRAQRFLDGRQREGGTA